METQEDDKPSMKCLTWSPN